MTQTRFDVAVIGGGINGTAVARSLAHRGVSVLLLEKGDFGMQSSARSSRMMHCGLNYLAEVYFAKTLSQKLRNLKLARKMMQERAVLWKALPGRFNVHPFLLPIYEDDAVGGRAYDLAFRVLRSLGGYGLALNYQRFSGAALAAHPLRPYFGEGLVALVSFDELIFNWPEGVCADYARDAHAKGAVVLNYARLTGVTQQGRGWQLEVTREGQAEVKLFTTDHVVNMAGVETDPLNQMSGAEGLPARSVTPNKGCHIAVRLPEAFAGYGVIRRNDLGHLFLAVPWRNFHIIGPTETQVSEPIFPVTAGTGDVAELLAKARENLPGLSLSSQDVLFQWAGYRPAAYDRESPRGLWLRQLHAGQATGGGSWVSIAWGRLADHRITADDVCARLQRAGLNLKNMSPLPILTSPSAEHALGADGVAPAPHRLQDALFSRLGTGWSTDLGVSNIGETLKQMGINSPETQEKLRNDYHAWLSSEFRVYRGAVAHQPSSEAPVIP